MNNPFENKRRYGRSQSQASGDPPQSSPQVPGETECEAASAEGQRREARAPGKPGRRPMAQVQPGVPWRGITWQDVPGHDESIQRLNFSLLKRGMLDGHKSCRGLEGEALKAELGRLSSRNRGNSSLSYKRAGWRKPALPPAAATADFSSSSSSSTSKPNPNSKPTSSNSKSKLRRGGAAQSPDQPPPPPPQPPTTPSS